MRKIFTIFFFLCIPIFLTGYWNHKELTDIGIVAAVGIDKGDYLKYKMTFQIINQRNVSGTQQSSGLTGPPVTIYQSEGNNMLEAARNSLQHVSRQMYFAHANLFVISEEVAREGIGDILDLSIRSPDFRATASVVIAKDAKAGDILSTLTPVDQIPANKVNKLLDYSEMLLGKSIQISVGELVSIIQSKGSEGIINGFVIRGDEEKKAEDTNLMSTKPLATLNADGIGIFNSDRLITWANGTEARGINWIINNLKSTIVNFDWNNKKDAIGVTVSLTKAKIKADIKNNKPHIKVHVDVEGNLTESTTFIDLSKSSEVIKIQKAMSKEIHDELQESIAFAQKHKADVFGFGDKISHIDEDYWKKVENDWQDKIFPYLDVDVEVNGFIRRTGLISKPFIFEDKKE